MVYIIKVIPPLSLFPLYIPGIGLMLTFPSSFLWCRVDVDREALEPLNDDAFSECSNLEAEVGLSMQLQLATILSFSYIWSIGAFIPFR